MSTTLHEIEDLIISLEKTFGFPIGWKAYDREDGKRVLALSQYIVKPNTTEQNTLTNAVKNIRKSPFTHESRARSEFTGYLKGIIEGYAYARTFFSQSVKHNSENEEKLTRANGRLQILCAKAQQLVHATDQDIYTDAPECRKSVAEVTKASSELWVTLQGMPADIRNPKPEDVTGMKKEETLRQKELEAIQLAADLTDRTIGADEVQCDLNSEVEFVEGGAWVSIRVFVSPDEAFGESCKEEFEDERCLKPVGHTDTHVSLSANW